MTATRLRSTRLRRAVIGLSAAGLLAATTVSCTHAANRTPNPVVDIGAARIHGPLHTEGTRIVDATGATVRFIGVDLGGLGKGDGLPGDQGKAATGCPGWELPPAAAYTDVPAWGFNTVRVSLSWANLQPDAPTISGGKVVDPKWNTAYLQALDQVVDGFTSKGMAVILHMSQSHWSPAFGNLQTNKGTVRCAGVGMPDWLYTGVSNEYDARRSFFADENDQQELYADAWRFVAARYASNKQVVAADMMNEPYTKHALSLSELHLDDLYTKVGDAIRSADPTILLAFQDSQYTPGGSFALSAPPSLPDVVYTFHYYVDRWAPTGQAQIQTYVDRAQRWNVPLWIGEFDAFSYASPRPSDPQWQSDLTQLMQYTKRVGISWTEFTYADRWMLQPGTTEPKPDLLRTLKRGV